MSVPSPPIETLVPHRGAMCLLDAVIRWDDRHALCYATSHTDPANPLREGTYLPASAGIEYAAQAIAVHGGLIGGRQAQPAGGYLASLRDVVFDGATLDELGPELTVSVERIVGDATTLMYRFTVGDADRTIVRGRATVVLKSGTRS